MDITRPHAPPPQTTASLLRHKQQLLFLGTNNSFSS